MCVCHKVTIATVAQPLGEKIHHGLTIMSVWAINAHAI